MRTEELIIQLAGSAGPVRPIPPPARRLASWTAVALGTTALGAALLGIRPDSWIMLQQARVFSVVGAALATALISAGVALVLGVPGAERSAAQRWAPIVACGGWIILLALEVLAGGTVAGRIAAFPFHAGCVLQIAALASPPGWLLFAMLRRAAPLRRRWSAGLASLAALSLAAAGTQFLCPLDDPAHWLVGHFGPVIALALTGVLIGRPLLGMPAPYGRGAGHRV